MESLIALRADIWQMGSIRGTKYQDIACYRGGVTKYFAVSTAIYCPLKLLLPIYRPLKVNPLHIRCRINCLSSSRSSSQEKGSVSKICTTLTECMRANNACASRASSGLHLESVESIGGNAPLGDNPHDVLLRHLVAETTHLPGSSASNGQLGLPSIATYHLENLIAVWNRCVGISREAAKLVVMGKLGCTTRQGRKRDKE
eukprot:1194364-Prorocentrum_minimum.AAC.5